MASEIYKLCYLKNNIIEKIHVYKGDNIVSNFDLVSDEPIQSDIEEIKEKELPSDSVLDVSDDESDDDGSEDDDSDDDDSDDDSEDDDSDDDSDDDDDVSEDDISKASTPLQVSSSLKASTPLQVSSSLKAPSSDSDSLNQWGGDQTPVFNKEEHQNIRENNIQVEYFDSVIHDDDTIETIKKKIVEHGEIAYEEIYLFFSYKSSLNSENVYRQLTHDGKLELNRIRLIQFLININYLEGIDKLSDKEYYTYEDILELKLDEKEFIIYHPLGQKCMAVNTSYPFAINPYTVIRFDPFLEKYANQQISTTNLSLLMTNIEIGSKIYNNTIYVCTAQDVLNNMVSKQLSVESSIKIYFPYLEQKNIISLQLLDTNRNELLENSKKLVNKEYKRNNDNVNLFYNIYKKRLSELNYINKGINKISFYMHSNNSYILPLNIIFKIIHATKLIPFIKYNKSKKTEKIIRLYANKITADGKKVPYLNKSLILKLIKILGKNKTVACYIEYEYNGSIIPVVCEFHSNASIFISIELKTAQKESSITTILQNAVNPVINNIKTLLEQSGYTLPLFKSFYEKNIEIENIEYVLTLEIMNIIDLTKNMGCISSIFNVEQGKLSKGINMRFKRVSNYNEMDSMEAHIIDLLNQKHNENEIIENLTQNFRISESQARIKLADIVSSVEVVKNLYKTKSIKIKNNPGFLTSINQEQFTNNINITVSGINNILYLNTLQIYLDSLIRITQNPDSTSVSIDEINELCYQKKITKEKVIEDIVAPAEKSYPENEQSSIIAEELIFDSDNQSTKSKDEDDILDMLLGSDEDDAEEEAEEVEAAEEVEEAEDAEAVEEAEEAEEAAESEESEEAAESEESEEEAEESEEEEAEKEEEKEGEKEVSDEEELGDEESQEEEAEKEELEKEESDEEELGDEESQEEEAEKEGLEEEESEEEELGDEESQEEEEEEGDMDDDVVWGGSFKKKPKRLSIEEPSKSPDLQKKPTLSTKLIQDITGKSLANPNPFYKKLMDRDPKLFMNDVNARYNAYSRSCPWMNRRQPVILTDKEKEVIDKKHPGSYDEAIKYGSDKDKQYWYICPRYWSLKDNVSLTEEQAKSGKYGGIIPKDAKKVPPGANIFEFNDKKVEHIGKDGKYITHNPGFLKDDDFPDGLCRPCCFKNWDSKTQLMRRDECIRKEEVIDKPVSKKETVGDYIKGPEKFPLKQNRWGFLPIVIQRFIKTDNKTCQISITNSSLKQNHKCLLRHGVENNRLQSFIACIADAFINDKDIAVPSIKEMKKIIISSIDLDKFITYQNGTLLLLFSKKMEDIAVELAQEIEEEMDVDIDLYSNTFIYKNTNKENDNEKQFLVNAIKSFENFKKFLKSNNVLIDYTYLWDIICTPNPNLFPRGINLVILELNNDDLTENVKVICPTNHYSNEFYDINKQTLILIKNDKYYEPIYILEDKPQFFEITRLFSLKDKELMPNLKAVLEIIKDAQNTKCGPVASISHVYKFKENIILSKVLFYIQEAGYRLLNQIMNYNGKVIGIIIEKGDRSGFIPCYPSSLFIDLGDNIKWIDDDEIWKPYKETRDFLLDVKRETRNKILCDPKLKVIEDGLIVGIITETNQFIGISEPEQDTYGEDLEKINESEHIIADTVSLLSKNKDTERINYIKKIKLENNFYNTFRNTIRIILGRVEYIKVRKDIENFIFNNSLSYYDKLEKVEEKLREITEDSINFIIDPDDTLFNKLNNITTCIINTDGECSKKDYCLLDSENNCKLQIPKRNLITPTQDNEELYYGKMADELVRYNRIRHFIFEPQAFLSFSNVKYNLNDDEIIILQSLLTQEYFEDMRNIINNNYINNTSYDTVNPLSGKPKFISQPQILEQPKKILKLIKSAEKIPSLETTGLKLTSIESNKSKSESPDENMVDSNKPKSESQDENMVDSNKPKSESLDKSRISSLKLSSSPIVEELVEIQCKTEKKAITNKWRPLFPPKTTEIEFGEELPFCSFEIILTIIKDYKNSNIKRINQLKEILVEEYTKYENKLNIIANILAKEGKIDIAHKLRDGDITIDIMIMSENYYITNFDIILLAKRLNIPLILISSTKLVENNSYILIVNNTDSNSFYFVKVPGMKADVVLKYRLYTLDDSYQIPTYKFPDKMRTSIEKEKVLNIDDYIESNRKKSKKLPKKPKKLKIISPLDDKKEETSQERDYNSPTEEEQLQVLEELEELED